MRFLGKGFQGSAREDGMVSHGVGGRLSDLLGLGVPEWHVLRIECMQPYVRILPGNCFDVSAFPSLFHLA